MDPKFLHFRSGIKNKAVAGVEKINAYKNPGHFELESPAFDPKFFTHNPNKTWKQKNPSLQQQ